MDSSWCGMSFTPITHGDVAVRPYNVNIFLKCLAPLHWLEGAADVGKQIFLILSCLSCLNKVCMNLILDAVLFESLHS